MAVTTPVMGQGPKLSHTPPSRESNSGSPAGKFLRTLSGRSLRRFSRLKRNSNSAASAVTTFNATVKTIDEIEGNFWKLNEAVQEFTPSMDQKKRPSPLNLKMLSPPLTVERIVPDKGTWCELGTPIKMEPSLKEMSRPSPHKPLGLDLFRNRNSSGQWFFPRSQLEDHEYYHEEDSPTFLVMQRRESGNKVTTPGAKRFTENVCTICGEYLNALLAGERVIELSCEHQSHYQCYSALLESTLPNDRYPRCEGCLKECKPKEEEILNNMQSALLLTRTVATPRDSIKPYTLKLETTRFEKSLCSLYTPCEQLIKSTDVSSNGFRTPNGIADPHRLSYNRVEDDVTLDFPNSAATSKLIESPIDLDLGTESVKVNIIPQVNKVNVNEKSECVILPFVLSCYVPNIKVQQEAVVPENIADNNIQEKIIGHLYSKLGDIAIDSGKLRLFDRLQYSLDGNQWTPVVLYFFEKCLLLVQQGDSNFGDQDDDDQDTNTVRIIGKIPMNQLSSFHKYDPNTLILDLKSLSFPEVYLQSSDTSTGLITKWYFYLANTEKEVPVVQQTTNCWSTLPSYILDHIPKELISYNQLTGDGLGMPTNFDRLPSSENDTSTTGVAGSNDPGKLQIVVAVSLINCNKNLHTNEQLLEIIQRKLREIKNALNGEDLLGLVLISKSGIQQGRFYGMVSKHWESWDEIINELAVHNNESNNATKEKQEEQEDELAQLMQTCDRLLSTVDEPSEYLRHLVILGNDYDDIGTLPTHVGKKFEWTERYTNRILNEYRFSITHYVTANSYILLRNHVKGLTYNIDTQIVSQIADVDVQELLKNLHSKVINQLHVELKSFDPKTASFERIERNGQMTPCSSEESLSLQIGGLKPGDSKSILFEMRLATNRIKQYLGEFDYSHPTDSSTCNFQPQKPSVSLSLTECYYQTKFNNNRKKRANAIKVQFSFQHSSYSPLSSPPTTTFNQTTTKNKPSLLPTDPDNPLFIDIPLVAPLTPSRDSIFVTRQLQFLVIDALNKNVDQYLAASENHLPLMPQSTLRELVSVLFGISRNCVCTLPTYYKDLDNLLPIAPYTESLCTILEEIAQEYDLALSDNTATATATATPTPHPKWLHHARTLLNSLI
ncbi:cyclin-dependent protein serine/threonine kinase inhibiting protein FAR1 Ecym_5177 [Eremothecium cymbalariae DBVPG|uniref:RING-type domain-containing protein n=1 Tax=Eremothecium cymbalariae (strain CBS 270.75 / DBVPG 7215 / KCTC 17166 / NRRL Y-17582) TaxID=931890 RepID=I6ND08_ERECY|nr:hypothetical protein Ecym_5177 [Eremothecium cymbalariae DBVPG\